MENGVDSYLHKKFKKQLSGVEATRTLSTSSSSPFYQYERETKKSFGIIVDSREEKSTNNECNQINDNQRVVDNNESVPNQSTNQISSSVATINFTKSSISIEECTANIQSSNSCISYVDAKTYNTDYTKANFDTTQTTTTSSILDNIYNSKPDNLNKEQDSPPDKSEQPIVEKSPAGKYVCPYCNLVCSKPSVLQKHIRAHTNERPYPCSSCGFSFKTRSNLYKHCRSRTHANRVMGNKVQEIHNESLESSIEPKSPLSSSNEPIDDKLLDLKIKPYKPRFHTFNSATTKENIDQEKNMDTGKINNTNLLSDHINDIISKNNSIVNSSDNTYFLKKRNNDVLENHNEPHVQRSIADFLFTSTEEPLNLTNKNRKRCMSEIVEPIVQKSLIKELLLKNLNSDMQCPHCKMIFQTVTELELHKLRSCKGFVKPGAKYTRSSSVNVASILTQNKNAFDNIPHMQNSVFPLKSPGPFLGKTRLVESDKNKSFSFDDGLPTVFSPITASDRFLLSPLTLPSEKEKKIPVKLFGGEVKITQTTGETKSFKIDNKEGDKFEVEFSGKISENRVVKSSLQSGGTVLTNKANYTKQDGQDIIRMYDATPGSPNIDLTNLSKQQMTYNRQNSDTLRNNDIIISTQEQFNNNSSSYKYTNIMDFSQKAVNLLTPNLKKINITIPTAQPTKFIFPPINEENSKIIDLEKPEPQNLTTTPKLFQTKVVPVPPVQANSHNPMKLLVNGKVVRYVPGIPGPVATEEPMEICYSPNRAPSFPKKIPLPNRKSPIKMETLEVKTDFSSFKPDLKPIEKSPVKTTVLTETKKFSRPNSLALKPTTASLKQHHGLTPTKFNQILISPDTPRVAKKYAQQFLHGNYFSYLGLKCSTKPVYCTLNKTQPFYVPHFKKLSMYSEWRQQDTKTEKLFLSGYDSRQRHHRFTTAGKIAADLVVHSSYKFVVSETLPSGERDEQEQQKPNSILGGYECNDDYIYIRGRGRGRYVCHQCGIRCKKPSMLKKHVRTHSNDRPYTCSHCNFSFKTKGNLTKHMKSKAHTKNYMANGSGSSNQHSGTQSSDSETDDSSTDSSDESTRREEQEAAYGLLSLSQKTSRNLQRETNSPSSSSGSPINMINVEEMPHISKSPYVKNKILDDNKVPVNLAPPKMATTISSGSDDEIENITHFLGRATINRPLTYPYTTILPSEAQLPEENAKNNDDNVEPKCIKQFHVIQKYAPVNKMQESPKIVNCEKVLNNVINKGVQNERTRVLIQQNNEVQVMNINHIQTPPVLKVNDSVVISDNQNTISDLRKRKLSFVETEYDKVKHVKPDEVMDLSMATEKNHEIRFNGSPRLDLDSYHPKNDELYPPPQKEVINSPRKSNNFIVLQPVQNDLNINYVIQDPHESPKPYKSVEFDNSAMETLADIATKQVKLEKNTLAKSVASEYLKIATKIEFSNSGDLVRGSNTYGPVTKEVNDLIVKPEGNKSCHICSKTFSKSSQLKLHMNIHYIERPFRCHSCSVSFRTKGHLQKHERSAGHYNKLSSSPALSSSEPRPFKCIDCNIAFRIHGHLAKHLRSKMHIMKLECLAKIPFGLYAELERSNSLLTEINTADGDQCLESLKTLAKKVFINDPNKLNQLSTTESLETDS